MAVINSKENIERLNKLKDETLKRYLEEIDLDNEMDVFDVMMHHFANGDLNDVFSSSVIADLTEDKQKELLEMANKHIDLCFYDGDADNWSDSIESIPITDYNLISYYLFDNYDFLLSILKDGGEKALEELEKYKDREGFSDSSTIDYLRRNFFADEIAKRTVIEMSKESSLYNLFTDAQKASLLTFPEGTLYFFGDEDVILSSPILLAMEIHSRMNTYNEAETNVTDIEKIALELATYLKKNDENTDFSEIVSDMSSDYITTVEKLNNISPHNMISVIKDINGEETQAFWNIQNNPLVRLVNTPYAPNNVEKVKK